MKHLLPIFLLGCIVGCSSGEDEEPGQSITIVNDSCNCSADQGASIEAVEPEADEEAVIDEEFEEEAAADEGGPLLPGVPVIARELAAAQSHGRLRSLRSGCEQETQCIINGTQVDIEAAIANAEGDTPVLSRFLAEGHQRPPTDSEELLEE